MKIGIFSVIVFMVWSGSSLAGDTKFSAQLFAKFQVKGCTTCHDFFEKERSGHAFTTHKGRTSEMCVLCHTQEVTGFKNADEWFARPGLYMSGMNAQQTCETTKASLNAKFKSKTKIARDLELHLFEDPRVLWGVEGATPKSGMLPDGTKEKDLAKGGLKIWKEQVREWIRGGMKCQ